MALRLTRGSRVGERYRLERELGKGVHCVTWEAVDERLDRTVALRIFSSRLDRRDIAKRAGVAASLTHPRVVRVFDTGEDTGRMFTVSEFLPESLRSVRLPLSPAAALQTATDVAEALQYAHERGVVHASLHEGNVLLSEGGAKVGDFGLGHDGPPADKRDDLRMFGALMQRVARTADPQTPAGFARIVEGLAAGAYPSAAETLTELRALQAPRARPAPNGPRRGAIAIAVAALLGLAAFGAMRLGGHQPSQRLLPGGRIEGDPLHVSAVDDFDPEGDGAEGASTVDKIHDSDPQTFWSTERYSGAADYSALSRPKTGVGVIFDLGRPTEVGKAQVLLAAPGCSFDLRYTDDRSVPVSGWDTAATIEQSRVSAAIEFSPARARYWLLWITRLTSGTPGAGGKFACGVRETDLYSP